MKEKDTGLEFDVGNSADASGGLDDTVLDENVRRWFRVPVRDSDGISVTYGGRKHVVVNFSKSGVAIRIPKAEKRLAVGEILPYLELILPDHTLHLRGKVVCFFDDDDGNQVCGLSFVDLTEADERRIDDLYWHLRNQLFSNE